jgi:hypothetical protein
VIREFLPEQQFGQGFALISEFFGAVQQVFASDWVGHSPKTSRLVHGAGIVALGFVMETIAARTGARTSREFVEGLHPLVGRTAWTSGTWKFSESEQVAWNSIENTPRQIMALSQHLVGLLRRSYSAKPKGSAGTTTRESNKRT